MKKKLLTKEQIRDLKNTCRRHVASAKWHRRREVQESRWALTQEVAACKIKSRLRDDERARLPPPVRKPLDPRKWFLITGRIPDGDSLTLSLFAGDVEIAKRRFVSHLYSLTSRTRSSIRTQHGTVAYIASIYVSDEKPHCVVADEEQI